MTETWLSWCVKRPGPDWKGGYTNVPALGTLDEKEGEVKHSAEGPLASLFHELDRPDRTASWTFSLANIGLVYQHYPLEWRAWHAGVAGDRRFDTSLIGNLTLIGEEHEGGGPNNPGEPLTALQRASSVRLSQDIRRLCPHVGANPPALRVNLWEHNWLSSTSCPSGRIPWPQILTALQPVTPLQEDDMPFLIHNAAGTYWEMCPGGFKKAITFAALQAYANAREQGQTPVTDVKLPDTIINGIPDLPASEKDLINSKFAELFGDTRLGHLNARIDQLHAKVDELEVVAAQVDLAAIAKAVNDDAYRRQKE